MASPRLARVVGKKALMEAAAAAAKGTNTTHTCGIGGGGGGGGGVNWQEMVAFNGLPFLCIYAACVCVIL